MNLKKLLQIKQLNHTHSSYRRPPINKRTFFLTFLGSGLIRPANGTWGTLAFMPFLYCFTLLNFPLYVHIVAITIVTAIACYVADQVQKEYRVSDPSWIVIDEVVGVWTTWLFLYKSNWQAWLAVFVLFRFFDIVKFWPASYLDQRVKNGMGTILDDNVSGIYSGIILLFLQKYNIV